MIMSKAERKAYDRHIDNIMVQNDVLDTAKMEGRKEGRKEAIRVTAKNLKVGCVSSPFSLIQNRTDISVPV